MFSQQFFVINFYKIFTQNILVKISNKICNFAIGPQHNKTVVCYISTWAIYRPEKGSFTIENFDPNLCTVAVYAFAGLDIQTDNIRSLGEYV